MEFFVLFRLLLLFIVVPFVELWLLLQVARITSVPTTLALVIVTGVIGTLLARSQGVRTYQAIQRSLAAGQLPTDSLIDGVLIFVAGAVLLTPGILTDLFGFALLIPFTRKYFRGWLVAWFKTRFRVQPGGSPPGGEPQQSEIIDSYVVDRKPEP